jgi:hypothetical protein
MRSLAECEAQNKLRCPTHGVFFRHENAIKALQKHPDDKIALKEYFATSQEIAEREKSEFIEEAGPTKQAPAPTKKPHYLSTRTIQPGNVQAFRESEIRFTNDLVSSMANTLGRPVKVETSTKGKRPGTRAGRLIEISDLDGTMLYTVEEHPSDLRDIYGKSEKTGRVQGLLPELKITDAVSKRFMYFEVKEQGSQGNAHERGYKLFTTKFTAVLQERTKLPYHAYTMVMYKSLSKDARYINEFQHVLEPEQYILAEDKQDLQRKLQHVVALLRKPGSSAS